jgi:hypothetical protein
MTLSGPAAALLDRINQNWKPLNDLRFNDYSARRFTQLIKLCIIYAAMRFSTEISIEDITTANTILQMTEEGMPKAIGEFGKARNSDVSSKIMEALYSTHKPITTQELWKLCSSDLNRLSELADVLSSLHHADKIQTVSVGKEKGWLPKQFVRQYEEGFEDKQIRKTLQ